MIAGLDILLIGALIVPGPASVVWAYKAERIRAAEVCVIIGDPPKMTCSAREPSGAVWVHYYTLKHCELMRSALMQSDEFRPTSKCVAVPR